MCKTSQSAAASEILHYYSRALKCIFANGTLEITKSKTEVALVSK